jgi:hypothetical protein
MNQPQKSVLSPLNSENSEIFKGVRLGAEHAEFVKYYATPRELRELKTHSAFSKKFHVSLDTLTDWKNAPGFWDKVRIEIRSREQDGLAEVIAGLRSEAEAGKPGAAKLWLQYIGELKMRGREND